jgi:two-component system CheB/CheR fusion protein
MKKRRPKALPKRKNAVLSPAARPGRPSGKTSVAARKAPLIVGVGASAGGLEAFTQLLHALPTDTGMAFVLVQHLEPSRESVLTKLLARATEMPVQEVREGMRAEPNQVYVIPANADLSLMDGLLHIVGRKAPAGHHLPIDYFFRSLAQTRKSQAIGVILSGTASDGTAGLHAIKAEGGITFAQEPGSAKFDGMPRSAIAAGCVDLVLPPDRIAAELARLARHPFVALLPQDAVPALPAKEEDWAHLFRLLRTSSGVDFTFYKKSTIKRRLARRMTLHKIETMGEYLKLIEGNREELDAIFREILIQVTSFFRDPEVFQALAAKIFPKLLVGKPAGEAVRIWVPGCSTGEEAYSIAICLLEHFGDHRAGTPIQIFATDISDAAIEKARAGAYPADALREVSPERVRRFFTQIEGGHEVNPQVREICIFARHDVTKDPAFSKLDLIACRNLLIYFEPILQRKVLATFHYALKSTGVLLLGKSEILGAFTDLFTIADRKNKFFIRNTAATTSYRAIASSFEGLAPPRGKQGREAVPGLELEREADRVVWEAYAHAGMVVSNDLQVLHYRGDVSPYLQPLAGKATFDLMRMVREELQLELRAAIQKARRTGGTVRREGIEMRHNRLVCQVNVEVHPLPTPAAREKCFLILFEQEGLPSEPPAKPAGGKRKDNAARDWELRRLRSELDRPSYANRRPPMKN